MDNETDSKRLKAEFEFSIDAPAFETGQNEKCRLMIPIPLPKYTNIDDWSRSVRAAKHGKLIPYETIKKSLQEFVMKKTAQVQDAESDAIIERALKDPNFQYKTIAKPKNLEKSTSFAEKFQFVVSKCSIQSLLTLMQMEVFMKKEMAEMIRARNWEVNQLSKQCEKILTDSQENSENIDMHPHKISLLNEKLRQVHTTYTLQIAQLSENQRIKYRKAVDSLYSHGSIPANLLEDVDLDENFSPGHHSNQSDNQVDGVQESFTIYIGAQLKSMHNACLATVHNITDLCQTMEGDWNSSSRLEMATKLYGRELSAVTLLVPKDPMYHFNSSSDFFKICEQSTELHFDSFAEQLKQVAVSTRSGNVWRADCMEKATVYPSESDLSSVQKPSPAALRTDQCLQIGDVYCSKHSNLHKMQIAFHLVVDDMLQSIDISSRHPCLNGLRNIIKLTSHFGITSIHIPLLLIDRPDESTTIAWCVKRAEMVYKCVKGYLMEVCGGTNLDSLPHYNVHFTVPSGLSPTIYSTITNMFPTIFHLVPSVSINV